MLLMLPAWAHVPHDVVIAVAPAPGLDPARAWWLVADHDDVSDLYRSDDGGRTWVATAGACLADTLGAAVTLEDGAVVLLGEGRVWWGDDGTWTPVVLPFSPTALLGGDRLYLGADDGVWALEPDGSAAQVWSGSPVMSLHAGAGGLVALLGGEIAFARGAEWSVIEAPPRARSATLDSAYVYVGTDGGEVLRFDGEAWIACGASPLRGADPAHPQVVRLATDGTTLALAHADAGPAVSIDACASWTAEPAPLDLVWRGDLEADDYFDFTELDEAFTALFLGSDRMLVGTYDGVATWVDGEWSKPPLKGADYPRGVAFSRDFETDGLALVAAYGCGVARAFEAGARWDCPGIGLTKPAVQDIAVPPDAVGLVPAYALSDRVPVRSDDGGATWIAIGGDFGPASGIEPGPAGRLWIFPVREIADGAPADTLRSDDAGVTWHAVEGLSLTGDHVVARLVDRGDRIVAGTGDRDDATSEAIYVSDDGESFAAVHEMNEIADIAVSSDRIVAVGPDGIDVEAHGVWTRTHDEPTRRVIVASDGTFIAATRTQHLLRSDDGGDTWEDLGIELPGQIEALATHPDFATHPEIVAMTPAGAFRVADGGVDRWMGLQQADDQSHYAEFAAYEPASDDVPREGAQLGSVHVLGAGDRATVWLRGTDVEIVGEGDAEVEVRVDDFGGLNFVEFEILSGEFEFDAARGIETSTPLSWEASRSRTPPADASPADASPANGCRCATEAGPGWGLGLGLLAALRRRRLTAGSAPPSARTPP